MWNALINEHTSSVRKKNQPGYYALLSDLKTKSRRLRARTNPKLVKQIELDLLRTFPGNKHFQVCCPHRGKERRERERERDGERERERWGERERWRERENSKEQKKGHNK